MKILHKSITVKNMDQSIAFYQNILGLKLLSRREIPENKAEIAFLGDSETDSRIELTYWLEKTDWTEGDELDHLAFAVPDMDAAMTLFKNNEVNIALEPYSLQGSSTRIAFITDPNGIWLEIVERS